MPTANGAELIVRLLERQGITTIPGIPGGANLPLYDALGKSRRIRHILARHEQGAGFMAQGMARVTGRPAVCLATSGPGATNVLTAIADAKLDSVPVVCITGQVSTGLIGTDAFQEVDTYGMSLPITKHNFLARSAAELLDIVPEAFRLAASDRPGPVLIDVPKDVQLQEITFDAWPEPGTADSFPEPDEDAIAEAAHMIEEAKRPVLCVGGGVIQSQASATAVALAEKASIPVATTLMALGAIPHGHPQSIGMLGMHGPRYTNMLLDECDLLIVAGARFDDRATGKVAEFCRHAKIIHIDIDPAEMDKIKTAHVGITGDAADVLDRLLRTVNTSDRSEWTRRVNELRKGHPLMRPSLENVCSPYGLIQAVADAVDDNAAIATDVGQHQMWVAQAYPFKRPQRWLTSGGLGTMGFGLPSAIGAAMADPHETVVCFSGDGSLLMNIQELAVLAEERLNVKLVLMNNNALGLVGQQQDLFYEGRRFAADFEHAVDFPMIARGFGVPTVDLAVETDPRTALTKALQTPGPCMIHVPIDASDHVYPMVPPGAANRQMIGGERHVDATA